MPAARVSPSVSLDEYAYTELRNMIIRRELKPGEQVVQEDVALHLGISRTPVRRALASLAKENFVVLVPRGGAYVRKFDPKELISIFEIRAVLEGLACRLVAPNVEAKHTAYLRSLITNAARSVTSDDWSAYRDADMEFHMYLTNVANDSMLSQALGSFQIVSLSLAQGLLRPPEETLPEHLEVLDALERHDAESSERSMALHIRRTLKHIRSMSKLYDAADGVMKDLASEIRGTASLAVRDGPEAIQIHQVEGQKVARDYIQIGVRKPLHCSGAGKVLIAYQPEPDELSLGEMDLPALTDSTITDPIVLRAELAHVRSNGYALDNEECLPGIRSIAAPVFDKNNTVIAALSISAAASVMLDERIVGFAQTVGNAARRISARL